jgi:Large ribosomal RNA subunit accumulation protein YceD
MSAKTSTKAAAKTPWSFPVRRDDVPETGLHLDLVADAATRTAVAGVAGVPGLPRLTATFEVARQGGGLKVTGEVAAAVEQTCVVTLEPMTSEVREPIDLAFVPPRADDRADDRADLAEEDLDPGAADESEPLVDGVADLGVVATEFLLLAIDPYPRKPGVEFEPPQTEDSGGHPFAALAALKQTPEDKG